MPFRFATGFACVLFAFLAGSVPALAQEPGPKSKLVWGLVPDAPPTTYVDAAGKPTGYYVELYSRIMGELGIDYEFRVAPFAELYPLLVAGRVDFFVALQKSAERETLFVFPDQAVSAGWGQLFVAPKTRLESILDLQLKKIGVVKDERSGQSFRSYMESLNIHCEIMELPDFEGLVQGVLRGELFGGIQANKFVSAETRIQPTTVVFAPFRAYAVLSRKSERRAEFEAIANRYSRLVSDPNSYFYELQQKWLGREQSETVVIPAWLLAALATLFAGAIVSAFTIKALTAKLREANRDLERKVAVRSSMLVRAEKLAALGTLVSGVAHELNSPIQALSIAADGLCERSPLATGGTWPLLSQEERGMLDLLVPEKEGIEDLGHADSRATKAAIAAQLEEVGLGGDTRLIERCFDIGLFDLDRRTSELVRGASEALMAAARELASREASRVVMKEALGRMNTLVRALLIYTHQDLRGDLSVVSLQFQIDAALAIMTDRIYAPCTVERAYAELPRYRCYAEQLQQVWMCLITNAADAIGEKGRITIRGAVESGQVRVEVEDTGVGIPPELAQKIYEPFFTTKPEGKATGIGLSIASEIVRTHRGTLSFESRPGRTVFTVSLPAAGIVAAADSKETLHA